MQKITSTATKTKVKTLTMTALLVGGVALAAAVGYVGFSRSNLKINYDQSKNKQYIGGIKPVYNPGYTPGYVPGYTMKKK